MAEKHLTYGPATGPCAVCGVEGGRACSACRVDFYCKKEHQQADWKRHRRQGCGSIELRLDPSPGGVGRHLVAVKDIPAGSVLMRELPLLVFPDVGLLKTFSALTCVGCCQCLVNSEEQQCPRCGWPVCSSECSQRVEHRAECAAFQRANFKMKINDLVQLYDVRMRSLLALRMCLAWRAKGQGKGVADRLRNLQSSVPDIQGAVANAEGFRALLQHACNVSQTRALAAVKWLRETAGVDWLPEDELTRAVHAALLNAVDATFQDTELCMMDGIYAGLSMVEHACAPNACSQPWSLERPERVLMTLRDIAKGEHITISYQAFPLGGAKFRRLSMLWRGFVCQCDLCRDPTERGLHLASWCCGICSRLGLQRFLHFVDWRVWRCEGCGYVSEHQHPSEPGGEPQEEETFGRLMDADQKQGGLPLAVWQDFIARSVWPGGPLHATHGMVLECKMMAIGMRRYGPNYILQTNTEDEAKILGGYCDDLLSAVDRLAIGANQFRFDLLMRRFHFIFDRMAIASNGVTELGGQPMKIAKKIKEMRAMLKELTEAKNKLVAASVTPLNKKKLELILETVAEYEAMSL